MAEAATFLLRIIAFQLDMLMYETGASQIWKGLRGVCFNVPSGATGCRKALKKQAVWTGGMKMASECRRGWERIFFVRKGSGCNL